VVRWPRRGAYGGAFVISGEDSSAGVIWAMRDGASGLNRGAG
jgi:hypothetical protein